MTLRYIPKRARTYMHRYLHIHSAGGNKSDLPQLIDGETNQTKSNQIKPGTYTCSYPEISNRMCNNQPASERASDRLCPSAPARLPIYLPPSAAAGGGGARGVK